ncbi:hypothetical protein N1031_14965 [Herbiconiux moechotypicola]|uniref:Uncharacterized protein n=1 Tax=Herbiconiux moechotypicola TaxID=637393 RepID=A0ABN3DU28_9MICO|nr:hypothetical protein [Herbiconiux moechotypicola]MCS5731065.1 hypothetical protein [Herbiconiux moechotypicola]
MFHTGGGPLSVIVGVLGSVFSLLAAALAFAVVVGVLILLVRFLWFGTRAAQLYLEQNGDSARFSWPVRPVGTPPAAGTDAGPASEGAPPAAPPTVAAPPEETAPPRSPLKPKSAPQEE